jgi:hypothetical protein
MAKGAVTVKWVKPPKALQASMRQYGVRVRVAIQAVAEYIAIQAQNEMRHNAPWRDRTGNARNGLFSFAERAARDIVTIYLSHGSTIHYGIFLETNYGGKYAIIIPTIQRLLPQINVMLQGIFR